MISGRSLKIFGFARQQTLRSSANPTQILRRAKQPARLNVHELPARWISNGPFRGGTKHQYNRFTNLQAAAHLWGTSPTFRALIFLGGGVATLFVAANIETVPVSGRWRFNCISPEFEAQMGKQSYQVILRENSGRIYPADHPSVIIARKVVKRLLAHSDLDHMNADWQVYVIDADHEVNAFVVPGGKVFVFSGILPICENEDGLAAVLSHEIAHNVAHHAAEAASLAAFVLLPLSIIGSMFFDVSNQLGMFLLDLAVKKPGSRKHESEADYIGLLMMSKACYEPRAALEMWERMEKYVRHQDGNVPGWLSTHPTNERRIADIRKWLPTAQEASDMSDCARTSRWNHDFVQALSKTAKWSTQ